LQQSVVRFDEYEVDLQAGHLYKRGLRLKLHQQSFRVLASLIEAAPRVVTRDDLRCRLWPPSVFVDFENNLNAAVARLRQALGDTAAEPRFIETVPKRGYRLLASFSTACIPRLLVLPLADGGASPREYLGAAVAEAIIRALSRISSSRLVVIGPATSLICRTGPNLFARIGREVAADFILEGEILHPEGVCILNLHLIRVADRSLVWTRRFEVPAKNLLDLEHSAAVAVAAQFGIDEDAVPRKPACNPIAYDLYLQGRYNLFRATPSHIAAARGLFEQALVHEADFALAFDSLAELYWYTGFLGFVPPRESSVAGLHCAVRALEIDNSLAETHALLGAYRKDLDYDWSGVDREMALARQLNPAAPLVRLRYATSGLMPHGRLAEAAMELQAALDSDPLSPFIRLWLAVICWLARDFDRAFEHVRFMLEADPDNYLAHFAAGVLWRETGVFDEAIAAHRCAVDLSGGSPLMLGWLGLALAQSGDAHQARELLQTLEVASRSAYVPPTSFAWIHLGLGDVDAAFSWMNRAIDARDHMMIPIKSYPFFDPIRSDPRYPDILARMNLHP
jgi:DNA-binding winged helix-turn-helix (wHTH) protein/tetratricopeptide (TPR) repeat protein